ncbi:hypothetical protein [Ornithinimicrobium kibberense]|uniref:hypothetical protein n=1 Tax=Ornithinimicrobium kibberense TaxID=282060 RepID=UPI0036223E75
MTRSTLRRRAPTCQASLSSRSTTRPGVVVLTTTPGHGLSRAGPVRTVAGGT